MHGVSSGAAASRDEKARYWRRAWFKESTEVWAACDPAGAIPTQGTATMRYAPDGKDYSPLASNIKAMDGTMPVQFTDDGQVVQMSVGPPPSLAVPPESRGDRA